MFAMLVYRMKGRLRVTTPAQRLNKAFSDQTRNTISLNVGIRASIVSKSSIADLVYRINEERGREGGREAEEEEEDDGHGYERSRRGRR